MKKKLIIITNWIYPIEKTWSGTSFAISSALKNFFDVEIKNLNQGFLLKKLYAASRRPVIGSFFGKMYRFLLECKANRIIGKDKTVPVFEICQDFKVKNPYFTYQDMTWFGEVVVKKLREKYTFIVESVGDIFYSKKELYQKIVYQKEVRENS